MTQFAGVGWLAPSVLVAIAALGVSLIHWIIKVLVRRRRAVRGQAEQVTIWVDRAPDGSVQVSVMNASGGEITDVMVWVARKKHNATSGQVRAQSITPGSIGPKRTTKFPVAISANPAGVDASVGFKDSRGVGWSRAHGELRRFNFNEFSTGQVGLGAVHRADAVVELKPEVAGAEGVTVSSQSFTVTSFREDQGHSVSLTLVPDHVAAQVVATAELRHNEELVTATDFDAEGRVVRINNFRLTNPRAKFSPLRMIVLDEVDTLLCLFQGGEASDVLDRTADVRHIPALPDVQTGEVLLDSDGDLLAISLLNASTNLHPSFWELR